MRILGSLLATGLIARLMLPAPVAAQDAARATEVAKSPVCMARAFGDVPQVSRERQAQVYYVAAPSSMSKSLAAKGFTAVDCETAQLATPTAIAAWRDQTCELAAFGNAAVQNQLETALGERPGVLCAMAQVLVGPWDRKRAKGIEVSR